jgi:hypothetical protein
MTHNKFICKCDKPSRVFECERCAVKVCGKCGGLVVKDTDKRGKQMSQLRQCTKYGRG